MAKFTRLYKGSAIPPALPSQCYKPITTLVYGSPSRGWWFLIGAAIVGLVALLVSIGLPWPAHAWEVATKEQEVYVLKHCIAMQGQPQSNADFKALDVCEADTLRENGLRPKSLHKRDKLRCAAKWPNDFAMQKYCGDENSKAAAKFKPTMDLPKGNPIQDIALRCMVKWQDETYMVVDYTMAWHCFAEQRKAYQALK